MAVSKTLTPQAFATQHRALVEEVVAPVAKQLKAKSLNDAVADDLFARRDAPAVKLVLDTLSEIRNSSRRAVPLKQVYETSEALALDAAAAAAKSTKGVLNAKSARFLPYEYQADFEKIAGVSISGATGAAVKGVSIKQSGTTTNVKIDFERALEGQTAQKVVLGLTKHAAIIAEKVNPPADPNLPPYWIYISPREAGPLSIQTGNGISGFGNPENGSLIRAGSNTRTLLQNDEPVATLNFELDQVNDIGGGPAPSDKTKAVREAWDAIIEATEGGYDFSSAIESGQVEELTRKQFEAVPGGKAALSGIREMFDQSITRLIDDGRVTLMRDPASNSVAASVIQDGELESWLYVVNDKKWVGTWSMADDGTRGWEER